MPRVFFVGDDSQLIKMDQGDFKLEADLQKLLEDHPSLLEGCTSEHEDDERSLLLVRREMSIPDKADGTHRWWVDLFFIDQAGVPTLVEVKRSKNGQLRREVVGQLLDYAANAAAYWKVGEIRAAFVATFGEERSQQLMDEFIGGSAFSDEDAFWQRVEVNLQTQNIRLVFVAEELPPELKIVIEFLNEQMRVVEVLGIEVGHYTDGKRKAIVPSVVGRTAQAESVKGRRQTVQRDYSYLDRVTAAFRLQTDNSIPLSTHTKHYRQAWLDLPAFGKGLHYEFLGKANDEVICEFHAEVSPRTELRQAMAALAGPLPSGLTISYNPIGRNGYLRVVPRDPKSPESVSEAMREFIDATKARLAAAALYGQQQR